MRRTALIIGAGLLPLAVVTAACGTQSDEPVPNSSPTTTTTTTTAPPRPEPARAGSCPYLDTDAVAGANGQRVTAVKVSAGDPPACFFYTYGSKLQLSAWVYRGKPKVAEAIVDRAAPVATSNKATRPSGWTGGSQVKDTGAVYAVLSGGEAVVVTTNQKQTVKAREIAEHAISALHLPRS